MQFMKYFGHRGLPRIQLLVNGELDGFGVEAEKPAAQPVIVGVLDDIEEWGRGDNQRDGVGWDFWRLMGRASEEQRLCGDLSKSIADPGCDVAKELACLFQDEFCGVASWWRLATFFVDLALGFDRHGLVGRERINREESWGVTGQTVQGEQANPIVNGIQRFGVTTCEQILLQGNDFAQSVGVVKDEKLFR